MALAVNLLTDAGITINNAYARIDYLEGTKERLRITVNYYKDRDSFLTGYFSIKTEYYVFVPTPDDNFIKEGYGYLKTLDKFAHALDILEDDQAWQ